ncbi:MAG: MBL fold metallo-hydrolase [Candidatus Aquicultorales bacterium]
MEAAEVNQLDEHVYYFTDGSINLGIVKTAEDECAVIDTGVDDDTAARLLAATESLGLAVTRVINTHAHADHFGGNAYLVERTEAVVYAPQFEAVVMNQPSFEPFFLFGAKPISELKDPNLMAHRKSPIDFILTDGELNAGDRKLGILPLPGHSPNQIGVVAEAVCFVGDAVFSEEAWKKHVLVYLADVEQALDSLERLRVVGAREFVPSHSEPTGDIGRLIEYNIDRIRAIADQILDITAKPTTAEEVLKLIADKHGLAVTTPQQFYLTYSAVKAYLSYLADRELVRYYTDANRLFWEATD